MSGSLVFSRVAGAGAVGVVVSASLVACSSKEDPAGPPPPCVADAREPNESAPAAIAVGSVRDDNDIGPGPEAAPRRIDQFFSTHVPSDVDWFVVDVLDTGIGGNPALRAMAGEGHEVTAFFTCTSGTTRAVACGLGTPVTSDPDLNAKGCMSQPAAPGVPPQVTMTIECDGTSTDNGRLHVRVKRIDPAAECRRYRLIVEAE